MNTKEFDYGAKPYMAQSNLYLKLSLALVSSIHHSHHHEHPAH